MGTPAGKCVVQTFVFVGQSWILDFIVARAQVWRFVATPASTARTHTLVVDEGVDEMITYFQVNGAMIYVDPDGKAVGYDDVFTKIELCRNHYENIGLGADFVNQFIR